MSPVGVGQGILLEEVTVRLSSMLIFWHSYFHCGMVYLLGYNSFISSGQAVGWAAAGRYLFPTLAPAVPFRPGYLSLPLLPLMPFEKWE